MSGEVCHVTRCPYGVQHKANHDKHLPHYCMTCCLLDTVGDKRDDINAEKDQRNH